MRKKKYIYMTYSFAYLFVYLRKIGKTDVRYMSQDKEIWRRRQAPRALLLKLL